MYGMASVEELAARQSEREMRRFTLTRFNLGDSGDGRARLGCPVDGCAEASRDGGPCRKHWRHRPAWLAEQEAQS
jgi:hypothetical protein